MPYLAIVSLLTAATLSDARSETMGFDFPYEEKSDVLSNWFVGGDYAYGRNFSPKVGALEEATLSQFSLDSGFIHLSFSSASNETTALLGSLPSVSEATSIYRQPKRKKTGGAF